jgi:peptidyl-prolyl cis-trans isomerase B (cyclophilin B)
MIGAGVAVVVLALAGCGNVPNDPLGAASPSAGGATTAGTSAGSPNSPGQTTSAAGVTPSRDPNASGSPSASRSADATDTGPDAQATGPVDCQYTQTGTASRPVKLPPATGVAMTGTAKAVIKMTEGTVTVTLDRTDAPCTVNSFISLARQHFYDNTTCPRMSVAQSLFMLQCGDPTGNLTGGPGYSFPDELSGDESYDAGTVAMANGGPNTNGSQFFEVYRDSELDPNYTVFGHMDAAGIAVLNKIAKGGVDNSRGAGDGKPRTEAKIISVTIS